MTRAAFPAEREPYTGPATGDFDADLARFAYRRDRPSPHAPTEVIPLLPPYTGPKTGDAVTQVAKASFPTGEVYGATAGPELRLVTCGGTFDVATGSYLSNVIVYATETKA